MFWQNKKKFHFLRVSCDSRFSQIMALKVFFFYIFCCFERKLKRFLALAVSSSLTKYILPHCFVEIIVVLMK